MIDEKCPWDEAEDHARIAAQAVGRRIPGATFCERIVPGDEYWAVTRGDRTVWWAVDRTCDGIPEPATAITTRNQDNPHRIKRVTEVVSGGGLNFADRVEAQIRYWLDA